MMNVRSVFWIGFEVGKGLAVLQPLVNDSQREQCGAISCFFASGAVAHHAREIDRLDDPSAIGLAIDFKAQNQLLGSGAATAKDLQQLHGYYAERKNSAF
jgi:hypothetical protein